MKRLLAMLIVFCVVVMCACDSRAVEQSIQNTENLQSNVEEIVPGQQEEFSIVGKWEYGSAYHYFLEGGVYFSVVYENNHGEKVNYSPSFATYDISGEVLTIIDQGYEEKFTLIYSGDCLRLSPVDYAETTFELMKCDAAPYQYDLVGTWQIVGTDGEFELFRPNISNDYIRMFSFYTDGTYKADWYFTYKGEECEKDSTYGNYQLVNDGNVVCFDNRVYYECNRLGYGLIELTETSGNKIMYILQ